MRTLLTIGLWTLLVGSAVPAQAVERGKGPRVGRTSGFIRDRTARHLIERVAREHFGHDGALDVAFGENRADASTWQFVVRTQAGAILGRGVVERSIGKWNLNDEHGTDRVRIDPRPGSVTLF
jgi:hypothetical protein